MSSALLVGQPNVGKTCFLINFAQYLGAKKIKLLVKQPAGFMVTKTYQLQTALNKLTSIKPHRTEKLQHINIELPAGKQNKKIKLIDSCGLIKGIHSQEKIRQAMAQTLQKMFDSKIVLHMIDLNKFNPQVGLKQVDKELYNFLKGDSGYRILANKLDLDTGKKNLTALRRLVGKKIVLPISALYKQGFDQVKRFLLHNL